jgi:hypothetical protein
VFRVRARARELDRQDDRDAVVARAICVGLVSTRSTQPDGEYRRGNEGVLESTGRVLEVLEGWRRGAGGALQGVLPEYWRVLEGWWTGTRVELEGYRIGYSLT